MVFFSGYQIATVQVPIYNLLKKKYPKQIPDGSRNLTLTYLRDYVPQVF